MSALARFLHKKGHFVVGYDSTKSGEYDRIVSSGIVIFNSMDEIDFSKIALIVYSLAIPQGHPLIREDIPNCSRAELLGSVMLDYPIRIAVAGTHGKSTVTSLLHRALTALGEKPTTMSGADLGDGNGPLAIGDSKVFLYECCEYKNSFLYTHPTHALLLNLDHDHTDFFPTIHEVKTSFLRFAELSEKVWYFASDDGLSSIQAQMPSHAHPYYLYDEYPEKIDTPPPFGVKMRGEGKGGYTFYKSETESISLTPTILGDVGIFNTLAALTLLSDLGYDITSSAKILERLPPIARRIELLGRIGNAPLYYDFAHHPTEIRETISTLAKRYGKAPVVVFAPHTYTRTRDLWDGFVMALSLATLVFLCPITPARESPIPHVTSENLVRLLPVGSRVVCTAEDVIEQLPLTDAPIVLMGAGELTKIQKELMEMQTFIPIS
ncbi:MAG: hypothetical protein IKC72_03640 [Clostridia bacterium]|nr:hypothetical protein [Clostridia bacterium]